MPRVVAVLLLIVGLPLVVSSASAAGQAGEALDPRGKIHIPIGIADTVDVLKTFVEAEGNFSPGFGTYGVYFWLWDDASKRLLAPTMDGVGCRHGLAGKGRLIPWSMWQAGDIEVTTEVCQVARDTPAGAIQVAAARTHLKNRGSQPRSIALCVVLRPLGAAGGPIGQMTVSPAGDALLVDRHPAVVADGPASRAGVSPSDSVGQLAMQGETPGDVAATSAAGECSGVLRFDLALEPGQVATRGFVCPVLPGRRAAGHQWDGVSTWAQFDLNKPNPESGGQLQPDAGLDALRNLSADALFEAATAYWKDIAGRATIDVPDARWGEAFAAIVGHSALCMNQGAPDVAVANYNVFNRDGVYMANIFQKAGHFELARAAIDYFLGHPFNGRIDPEADNPGQILWVMGQHWQFTRDRQWLARVYPSASKIAAMIRYYRTTPEPHWVCSTSLDFGDALPAKKWQPLRPGACDGHHPEYTEAFDVAGLRAAAVLAEAIDRPDDAAAWRALADELMQRYDRQFAGRLPKDYGSYCVLWPCRLYRIDRGPAFEQFRDRGAQRPTSWRYFPLATAHQGLLTGNRAAGWQTLAAHLDQEQMQGWYAFDEGGPSGTGGWNHVRTRWKQGPDSVAMPHGWAIAELQLLLRDSLAFEDAGRLVLFGGVPTEWFSHAAGMRVENLPTHFGPCTLRYAPTSQGATLALEGPASPPEGYALRLPATLAANVTIDDRPVPRSPNGDYLLPPGTKQAAIQRLNPKP